MQTARIFKLAVPIARVVCATLTLTIVCCYLWYAFPQVKLGVVPGWRPDSTDYAYGAQSLMRGEYFVAYEGDEGQPHVPRYSPGYSLLLIPAVALGGVESAVWMSYLFGLLALAAGIALAHRLGGSAAALLFALSTVLTKGFIIHVGIVMSDVPSAALLLVEAYLLCFGRGRVAYAGAGAIAGRLVCVRPANAVLLAAGLAVILVSHNWRPRAAAYLLAAAPFGAGLALWQWWIFGSPLRSGYQAVGASPGGGQALGSFFGVSYITGAPYGGSNEFIEGIPNFLAYTWALAGGHWYLTPPGIAIVGMLACLVQAWRRDAFGAFARFTLVATLASLALYVPYFWQDPRFMYAPALLLTITGASSLRTLVGTLASRWAMYRRDHNSGDARSPHGRFAKART